jgi:DNA invertase Pin-like site-specific DNA recombinase
MTGHSTTERIDVCRAWRFAVLAAAAEYELELRAERQAEGIAAARRRPAPPGRGPDAARQEAHRPSEGDRPGRDRHARRLVADSASVTQAGRHPQKISRSTAYAALASTR